jgi:hypothetical protein
MALLMRIAPARAPIRVYLVSALLACGPCVAPAGAKVFLTQAEALRLVFGETAPEKRTIYLTEEQAARVRDLSGTEDPRRVIVAYASRDLSGRAATAYFDTHLVRTLPQTIMVVAGPDGRAARVEILSFDEPEDYLPKRRWIDQFHDRALGEDLSLKGSIRAIAGATLSSKATTDAVRRLLAIHAVTAAPAGESSP